MIIVPYLKENDPKVYNAVFENIDDARLWWDSINYLNSYTVLDNRP